MLGGWLVVVAVVSCSRANPAYDDGDASPDEGSADGDGTRGSTGTSPSSITIGEGSGEGSSGSSGEGSGEASTGVAAVCGNGIIEDGEDCDDGNTDEDEQCNPQCRVPGEVVWSVEFAPPDPGLHRFNEAILHQGDLVAVGRAVLQPMSSHEAVVVRYDLETGDERSRGRLPAGWQESEAYSVVAEGGRLFVSGDADISAGLDDFSAFAACLEVSNPDAPPASCWRTPLPGAISRGIIMGDGVLQAVVGPFLQAGMGLAEIRPGDGVVLGTDSVPAIPGTAQLEALVHVQDSLLVGGMLDAEAFVADVTGSMLPPEPFVVRAGGLGLQDSVQTLAAFGADVIAGGWLFEVGSGSEAWIGRYSLRGAQAWEHHFEGGSFETDEIEDVVVDDAGHVIAVGMTSEPSTPTVWKLDGGSGDLIWQRSYPEVSPGDGYFRGVVVDGDIFVVGERNEGPSSLGVVMRLVP